MWGGQPLGQGVMVRNSPTRSTGASTDGCRRWGPQSFLDDRALGDSRLADLDGVRTKHSGCRGSSNSARCSRIQRAKARPDRLPVATSGVETKHCGIQIVGRQRSDKHCDIVRPCVHHCRQPDGVGRGRDAGSADEWDTSRWNRTQSDDVPTGSILLGNSTCTMTCSYS